ncbi:type II secretion system F family protein [Streptomyces sp. J2-1]|uniref:type II secretion system F family protein n=1 Tax=Streptomyces corallincola TaxID=2851888 RepID=UPI001C383D73|nr:type II secretion system F family protein [Streptomyces corallincola]MBV2357897.1 type II secretion system F family protein [Streptomyces corallincola]
MGAWGAVHGLGAVVLVLLVAGWVEVGRRSRGTRRRAAGLVAREVAVARAGLRVVPVVRRWAPVVGAGCGVVVLVGGVVGAVLGAGVAVGVWRWQVYQARARPVEEPDPGAVARQLPLAADLLAACVAAGAGPAVAAFAVGEALGGPVGDALARGAAEVRLGGDHADAWRRLARIPGAAALARLLERAGDSGLPAAGPAARIASDARAEWARDATARARRAAVMVAAPVGLCFLPAFIALGVLPVVIGLAGGVLGGGGS